MNFRPGLGPRLRDERERKGLNQADFAKLMGVGRGSQVAYENETTSPNTDYLAALDQAEIDVIYVLTGVRGGGGSLAPNEGELIDIFRALTTDGQETVLAMLRLLRSPRA